MKRMILVVTLGLLMLVVVGCGLSAEEATPTPAPVTVATTTGAFVEVVDGVEFPLGMVLYSGAFIPQEYVESGFGALGLPLEPFCNDALNSVSQSHCTEEVADEEFVVEVLLSNDVQSALESMHATLGQVDLMPTETVSSTVWVRQWTDSVIGNRTSTRGHVFVFGNWHDLGSVCVESQFDIPSHRMACSSGPTQYGIVCLEFSQTEVTVTGSYTAPGFYDEGAQCS